MNRSLLIMFVAVFGHLAVQAEVRTFTNSAGKTIEAELTGVAEDQALLKLKNGRQTKVPLASLSAEDQAYVKSWHEQNKDKVTAGDVRLAIEKSSRRIQGERQAGGNRNESKENSKTETFYSCKLDNYSKKKIEGLTADYIIYKRTSSRDEDGSDTSTEEIEGKVNVDPVPPNGTATFKTETVLCEDSSSKGKQGSSSNRESIVGLVVTLSAAGGEILKQSHPENLLDQMEEERKRQEGREKKADP